MRRTANVRVGELAGFCTNPEEAARLMREAIKWGIQQSRRTARMIKLERLLRGGVGTSRAERLGEGEALGVFHFHFLFREKVKVVSTLSLLLFSLNLCQCLKRA